VKNKKDKCLYDQLATEPDWNELFNILRDQYCYCKGEKLTADNDKWSAWSGEFNRYCNEFETEESYGDFSRLTQVWTIYTRLLALYSLHATATTSSGKNGKVAIRKVIKENRDVLKRQKDEFDRSLIW
jgi:hypothetical protein